ncbi:MAG TPA: STAS domain-containing protein [Phycisphaerae bacterium]|mgnify:CR=1 FL=1|nr:STAS domain-containing protein [Phycisphaerae bacterium]
MASEGGMVITRVQGATIVLFRTASILEGPAIEQIAQTLYALVDEQACRKLVLDFRAVNFMSSQMLGVLVSLNKRSAAIKGKVVLCALRGELKKVFEITRLDRIMNFAPDETEAIKQFDAPAR